MCTPMPHGRDGERPWHQIQKGGGTHHNQLRRQGRRSRTSMPCGIDERETHNNQPGRQGRRPCTPMPDSRDGQGDCGIKIKKEEGHTTINYGAKGGDHTLLCLSTKMNEGHIPTKRGDKGGDRVLLCLTAEMDKETMVSTSKRRRDTSQSTIEAREEITHSYALWCR